MATASTEQLGKGEGGLRSYYISKLQDLTFKCEEKQRNWERLRAQRNELNMRGNYSRNVFPFLMLVVRLLREEIQYLLEPGSYVGEVVKAMGKTKVLVKVHPEGKYVVDIDKSIDITKLTPGCRVALKNDSYVLHKVLPNKVDPLVSLMRVEKVPDSTYDMVGGLDKQVREIKEVCRNLQMAPLFTTNRSLNFLLSTQSYLIVLALLNPRYALLLTEFSLYLSLSLFWCLL